MNKPLAIAYKPFRAMKANTNKERSYYTQSQQFAARVLLAVWLLASGSPESILATPKRQSAMTPATTTSPGDPSLASVPPLPGGILPLPPDSPGAFWGDSVASIPSIDATLQERMSQEAASDEGRDLLRTSPKVSPVEENLSFEARGGEKVRFDCQQGQWHAKVSSHIGAFSRRAVLPVVCGQGEAVASSLEVLSRYPSWYSQRQIHVLDDNVCPTLGEVVYVGELGLKGGGEGEASGSIELRAVLVDPAKADQEEKRDSAKDLSPYSDPPLVKELRALASAPQIAQQPDKLASLGAVLLKLAASKQEAGASAEDLSPYTEAAILYQHVLSICAQKADTLGSQAASTLAQSAYQGLSQLEASMLGQATGAAPRATTSGSAKALRDRIAEDKQRLEAIRTKAREEAERLAAFRDQQGSAEEVLAAEAVYIEGSKKLFKEIATEIKSVLSDFYQEGEASLGPAPCKYAVMGLGSLALQQTTPYSDLEFAILMGDAKHKAQEARWRAYFRKLTYLVHFRVINLGETVLPFSEYKISLDHLGRKGLNFDLGGKTPLGRKDKDYELIQPVAGMLKYFKNEDDKMEHMDKLLPFVLESTCHVHGASTLHERYVAEQRKFFTSQDPGGRRASQKRMMKKLLEGVSELDHSQAGVVKAGRKQAGNLRTFGPKLHPEDAGRLYDVKQEIYRLPDRLISGLAMYFGIFPESAWDAVEQLKGQGIIGVSAEAKQASHRLQYAVSFATMLRLATYIRYGQQKETLSGSASMADSKQTVSELFSLPKEALAENGSLFKYYYTALALHREMEEFFKVLHLRSQIQSDRHLRRMLSGFSPGGKYAASKEKAYFCSSGFYDNSCAAKLAIYNRLLHYKQAAKCAEEYLEKVKAGYNKKKLARTHHNLGVSYYHLGSFDKSFDHFKTSLELLEALYSGGDPQVAAVLRSIGIAHYNLSEFQESLEYFEQSLEMLQRLYQENHPETAQALSSVGAAYEQIGNYDESRKHKADALKMLQGLYPDKDPEVARARLSLGDAYVATGQLAESLDHKTKSLQMFRALYGKSHPEVARALLSLGESYALSGKLSASLEHKQEALGMLQALYGSSHPEVARARLSLGESYALDRKLAASLEHKQQALEILRVFYRAEHPEVTQALLSLNATYRLIQGEKASRQVSGHALQPLRTAHPQHLTLLPSPRHGKEGPEENTLLRNYYRHDNFVYVPSLFDEPRSKHVQDLHCQLMLREKQGKVKTPIALQDLFQDRIVAPNNPLQAVHRILLTGNPGTGKTTLSRQLAYQWAVGAWGQEFYTLYLLQVRNLQQSEYDGKDYDRKNTLATAIVNNCFSHDLPTIEAEYNRLRQHIEQELKRSTTLLILDGLDDRAGASEQILEQAQDQSASHKLLMLSRPGSLQAERRLAEIEIEHVGFNRAQLQAYLRAEVSDVERAGELLDYIGKHEPIRKIAHVPGYLKILCRYGPEQGSLPGLYGRFGQLGFWRLARYHSLEERPVSILARYSAFALANRCKTIYEQRQDQPRDARAALTTHRPHLKWRRISLTFLITCLVASVPVLILSYSELPTPPLPPLPPPCDPALWDHCLDSDPALEKATQSCLSQMDQCSALEVQPPSELQRSGSPPPMPMSCDPGSWDQCLDPALEKATESCLLKMPECSELVEARQQLRDYYQQEAFTLVRSLFEEHHSWHVQDLECQLMLLEQKLVEEEKENAGDQEQAADSIEESQLDFHQARLQEVKTPIGLQDLFKDRSVHPDQPVQAVQRILLTGDPGTGKTTLSRQLAYQWAVGAWGKEFKAVYLLPVRNLHKDRYNDDNYRKLNTLSTAIVNICFTDPPSDEDEYKQLRKYIEEELKQPTTLVILDGLDEGAGASKEILRQAQKRNARHKLLMLSRPYGIDAERELADIEIEHVGFNDEQLEAYVNKELGEDTALAKDLLAYIQEHKNIRSISHVPVNLQILCALWQDQTDGVEKELEQGSLPSLYRQFIKYIWRRYKDRPLKDQLEHQDSEHLFNTLGKVALKALEKGEVLISPRLIDKTLGDDMDAQVAQQAFKDAGFLLLKYVGEDAGKQSGFYEFPHLTFQEYFAGRALAQQFLSENKREQKRVATFLSEHKYENRYGQTLSFMAGEVSRSEEGEFEGIKELLSLLGKSDQELVGVQHLLLQLRVTHEWLCLASEQEAERGMAEVEDAFQVLSSLEEWFERAFVHVRLEGYGSPLYDTSYLPGRRLLALLKSSLQTFGSVTSHAPGLLELFKEAAQGPYGAVRLAAVSSLGGAMAGVDDEARAMLQAMADDDYESLDIRQAANETFSQTKGANATQDETAVGGGTAQGSLGEARESTSQSPEALLKQLRQAVTKYDDNPSKNYDALRSARASFIQAVAAASQESQEKFGALLDLLLPAAKDPDSFVRAAAQEALLKAPLDALLAFYWSTPDTKLIPYITPRLYHTPLVVSKSARKGPQRVSLYAAAGQAREWQTATRCRSGILSVMFKMRYPN